MKKKKMKKLIKKLSKLKVQLGRYQGTDGRGIEMYGQSYYDVATINHMVKKAKRLNQK